MTPWNCRACRKDLANATSCTAPWFSSARCWRSSHRMSNCHRSAFLICVTLTNIPCHRSWNLWLSGNLEAGIGTLRCSLLPNANRARVKQVHFEASDHHPSINRTSQVTSSNATMVRNLSSSAWIFWNHLESLFATGCPYIPLKHVSSCGDGSKHTIAIYRHILGHILMMNIKSSSNTYSMISSWCSLNNILNNQLDLNESNDDNSHHYFYYWFFSK